MWVILVIFVGGMAAITAEVFLPGLVLGLLGTLAVCASIVMAYANGYRGMGHVLVSIAVLSIPLFFWVWKAFVVRYMSLQSSEADYRHYATDLSDIVGAEGVAETTLRPVGVALIGGRRVDVSAAGELIEQGTPIKVIEVTGNRVVVKRL